MDKKKLITVENSNRNQSNNIPIVENLVLIWLDNNIDDNRNMITQLKRLVNIVNTFNDVDQSIQFIEKIKNEKVCIIISNTLGQHIVSRIHDMSQVISIFIFSSNKKRSERWTKDWPKIKGVFTETSSIYEAIKQTVDEWEQNSISISFMNTNNDVSNKKLDQLDNLFTYTQSLKEILLTIKFEQEHIKQFINYCRQIFADNNEIIVIIKLLERKYHQRTPIWWYTSQRFLSQMLNRALRIVDLDIIIKMGFFINDLHRQIEQLHSKQFNGQNTNNSFTVYRGQGMTRVDFEQMTKTKGGLMSFNNFLSTNKDRDISLRFARNVLINSDLIGILFVMTINPSKSTSPFASIDSLSYRQGENEFLFPMNTVFRIHHIQSIDENHRLFQVDLILTNNNDKDLRMLTDRIRNDIKTSKGWDRLGLFLLKMGHFEKAQQIYEIMLNQTNDEKEKGNIYDRLGMIKFNQEEYQEALPYYEKSLEIYQKNLSPNHSNLAIAYNNIALMYKNMGEYLKALPLLEKALKIDKNTLSSNHPNLIISYNNIGELYDNLGDYSKALSYYEKVLKINKKTDPSNYSDLSKSYNNIGTIYDHMGEYIKALSYYEKALGLRQESLPSNHLDLATSYSNIGTVYNNIGEYSQALFSYEKAFQIQQESLPSNHPDLAMSYNNIGLIYDAMGEYSKALSFYEQALQIEKNSLPSNHPSLSMTYNNIANIYDAMGEYSKALLSHQKALQIRQELLPSNHPSLAKSYVGLGLVYDNMGEYSKAITFYEKALQIQEQSLSPYHSDLAMTYNNMGLVYNNMGEYSKALLSHEKTLEIKQKTLPSNHPSLAMSYNNIGSVYSNMGEYSEALTSHSKALQIREESLPPIHPDLGMSYGHIGNIFANLGEYSQALPFCERAVDIGQHSLPSNHPHLQWYKKNLDLVKKKLHLDNNY